MPWYIHTIDRVVGSKNCQTGLKTQGGERWVRAIPEPYTAGSIQAAWWVLTGRAFALKWPEPGDLERALDR